MSIRGEQQSKLTMSGMLGMSKADREIISQGASNKEEEKSSKERKLFGGGTSGSGLGGAPTVSFGKIPQFSVGYSPGKRQKGTSKTPRKTKGKASVRSMEEEDFEEEDDMDWEERSQPRWGEPMS